MCASTAASYDAAAALYVVTGSVSAVAPSEAAVVASLTGLSVEAGGSPVGSTSVSPGSVETGVGEFSGENRCSPMAGRVSPPVVSARSLARRLCAIADVSVEAGSPRPRPPPLDATSSMYVHLRSAVSPGSVDEGGEPARGADSRGNRASRLSAALSPAAVAPAILKRSCSSFSAVIMPRSRISRSMRDRRSPRSSRDSLASAASRRSFRRSRARSALTIWRA